MTGWVLPLLEASAWMLMGWCLADAWRRGWRRVAELSAGAVFGLLVEHAAIRMGQLLNRPDAYRYGPFAWFADDVPVAVVVAWGALLYAAMKYSDDLGVPGWVRPFVDGLYALGLDLSMEITAIHLGLWRWTVAPDQQWFGAPFSNFGGWLLLSTIFSAGVRVTRSLQRSPADGQKGPLGAVTYTVALLAIVEGGAWLTLMILGHLFSGRESDLWPVGGLALLAVAALLLGLRWRLRATAAQIAAARREAGPPPPWPDPARFLPLVWHGSYLLAAVWSGALSHRPAYLFLTGITAAMGVVLVLGLAPPPATDGAAVCKRLRA